MFVAGKNKKSAKLSETQTQKQIVRIEKVKSMPFEKKNCEGKYSKF